MVSEGIADERDTLEYLLNSAVRVGIPIRHAFVHDPNTGGGPGPLATFLRRPGTLDLFLLMLAVAVRPPHNVQYPAAVWSRALGRGDGTSAELWVSKSLRWLEDQDLIVRRAVGREREITIRHDSVKHKKYTRPVGGKDRPWEWFFNLSHAYFLDGWHKKLSASGKAILLVAHANSPDFELNQRRGAEWWGLSGDTLGRGLQDLVKHDLLSVRTITRKAPASRTGFTTVPRYTLQDPFTKPARGGRRPTKKGSGTAKASSRRRSP